MVVNTIRENDSEVALASGRLITETSVPIWAIEAMTSRVACMPSRRVLRPASPARQNSGASRNTPTTYRNSASSKASIERPSVLMNTSLSANATLPSVIQIMPRKLGGSPRHGASSGSKFAFNRSTTPALARQARH